MPSRATRREENQRLFRRGNERLHDVIDGKLPVTEPVPFLCECADEDCKGRVEMRLSEWESVTSRPNHFVVVAGHLRSAGEEAVD